MDIELKTKHFPITQQTTFVSGMNRFPSKIHNFVVVHQQRQVRAPNVTSKTVVFVPRYPTYRIRSLALLVSAHNSFFVSRIQHGQCQCCQLWPRTTNTQRQWHICPKNLWILTVFTVEPSCVCVWAVSAIRVCIAYVLAHRYVSACSLSCVHFVWSVRLFDNRAEIQKISEWQRTHNRYIQHTVIHRCCNKWTQTQNTDFR